MLPDPKFLDGRASESRVMVKRGATGEIWTYPQSSDRQTLTLPFTLTRQKSLELEAFVTAYQSARWFVLLEQDGSQWDAQLTASPFDRVVIGRYGPDVRTGAETVELTLVLSAKRLN